MRAYIGALSAVMKAKGQSHRVTLNVFLFLGIPACTGRAPLNASTWEWKI
jgi:hypothetical protein